MFVDLWCDLRCDLGFHCDSVFNYKDFAEYCSHCGEDLGVSPALGFLVDETADKWSKYNSGQIEDWKLYHFIEFMWDEGYEEGLWKERYEEKTGISPDEVGGRKG